MKNILAALFVFLAASCFGLDITTHDGKSYHDCTVKGVEREGLRIMHRDGTAFLDFDELPTAIQKQYGWTAEKSVARAAQRKAESEALTQRQAAEREAAEKARQAVIAAQERTKAEQKAAAQKAIGEREAKIQERKDDERMKEIRWYVMWVVVALVVLYPCFWILWIPPRLARGKSNYNAVVIMTICGLLVLPGVGWLIALYMALQPEPRTPVTHVTIVHAPPPQPRPVAVPRVMAKANPPPRNPPPV